MKYTTYIIIAVIILIGAGVVFYNYNIPVPWTLYIIIIIFLVVSYILIFFFTRETPLVRKGSETLLIMEKILNIINNNKKLGFTLVDLLRVSEKYYEGVNTLYKAFLFSTNPVGDKVIIWDTKKQDICDIHSPVSIKTDDDLFYSFNPFEGKFAIPPKPPTRAYVPLELRMEEKIKPGEVVDETE